MLKNTLFVLIYMCLFPISASASTQGKDYTVIKDQQEVRLVFEQCSRMTPTFRTSYRELDDATVKKIEAALPAVLQKAAGNNKIDINDYNRQYVAFEMLRREMVYINGFHKEAIKVWAAGDPSRKALLDDWQYKVINVCGGEKNYWGALYDAQNDSISELLFNSKAKKKK